MKHFSKNSFLFLKELKKNNNRDWFLENKQKYSEYIKEPILELTKNLEKKYGVAHVFRQNKDIRFSKDKSPYKTQASFVIQNDNLALLYFEFGENGIMLGGGIHETEKDQLAKWRDIFNDQNSKTKANRIKKFLLKAKKAEFSLMEEGSLKSAPRGYSSNNPDIYFINLKHIVLTKKYNKAEWMMGDELLNIIKNDLKILEEWDTLLKKSVGFTSIKKIDFKRKILE